MARAQPPRAGGPAAHRIPPQNLEAEQSVLGAILQNNSALPRAIEILKPKDFYREAHRKIFAAMLELFERGEPIDLLTLSDHLEKKKELEESGGADYVASLADFVATAAAIGQHARIVKERAILRQVIDAGTEMVAQAYDASEEPEIILDRCEQLIFEIAQDRVRPSFVPLKQVLPETFAQIEERFERKELVTGVPTGFRELDELTAGLQRSDLIVVAGRPGCGKTSFALNLAENAALRSNTTVGLFSLEMSKEHVGIRMLSSRAKVDSMKLRSGSLSREHWPRLTQAAASLSDARIFVDDSAAQGVLEIRAKCRRLQAEHGLGLVVVDYLQLVSHRGRAVETRQQEVAEITRSLKSLAKELQAPVVALSQLSRAVEQREKRRPRLSDLRESGAIEQDADVVIFVYRDEEFTGEGVAEIIVEKQRHGPTGTVRLQFSPQITRFADLETHRREEDAF